MASITGGNAIVMASVAMGLMFVVLVFLGLMALGIDGGSLSVAGIGWFEQKEDSEQAIIEEEKEQLSLDPESARQLLGFVDYPAMDININPISVFSPEAREGAGRLTETQIQQRCAFISVWFNREKCVQAERICAESISSDQEHWACLNAQDFWIGKKLSYLNESK